MTVAAYFEHFVSLIFPNICVGCKDVLHFGEDQICSKCRITMPKTNDLYQIENPLKDKFIGRVDFQYAISYLSYSKKSQVQGFLKHLKYADNEDLGILLGSWFGHELATSGFKHTFDRLIPVPLHRKKQAKRGYNQSYALCKGIVQHLFAETNDNSVIRTVNTDSQTIFSGIARWKNVEHIFRVEKAANITGQRIAIVDDVVTTGATIESLVQEIAKFNPASISLLCLADADRR